MSVVTPEMQKALEEDAEKLRQLTNGDPHEIVFFNTREDLLHEEAEKRYVAGDAIGAFIAGAKFILTGK